MKNRLKLYDDTIMFCINKKEKNKFRKIAFKNKMTISEYIRSLVKLTIALEEYENSSNNKNNNCTYVNKILGGLLNK